MNETEKKVDNSEKSISNIEKLVNELSETNKYLRHIFSWRAVMLRGLLYGFAIIVGSTILASIVFQVFRVLFGDIAFIPNI